MSYANYSQGKRQRAADKARKKREKAERRAMKRERGPSTEEIVSAEEIVGDLPTPEQALRNMEARAAAPRGANAVPCRLFVGGLSWDTNEETLRKAFEAHGPIADAVILTDRATGKSRGFGFVTMESRKDAQKAIEAMDGAELDGRSLVVNVATAR
jgi:RNA recognition motif-containing protein